MRPDAEIQEDVEAEIEWEPPLASSDIVVSVNRAVVTLSGFVASYQKKALAEEAAKRIAGVSGVANDIEVRLPDLHQRDRPRRRRGHSLVAAELGRTHQGNGTPRLGVARGEPRVAFP